MASVNVRLFEKSKNIWVIVSKSDVQISNVFRGNKHQAVAWARAWVSSWQNWVITIEEKHEKKD